MDQRLYMASCNGDIGVLCELLEQDPLLLHDDILTPSDTALHIATKLGHADFAKMVMNRNPELATELNHKGFSPIHLAATKGYSQIVADLLSINSKLCFLKDWDGRTPLHCAAMKGRQVVIEQLLSCCPEAAKELTYREETVLHLAVKNKQCEAFKSLLSLLIHNNIVDDLVNCVDRDGNTILHLATERKQVQIIKILLTETKVNVTAENANGDTALKIEKLSTSEGDDRNRIIKKMLYEVQERKSPEEQIVVVDSLQSRAELAINTTKKPKNLEEDAITTTVNSENPSEILTRLERRFESVKNGIIILASMCAAFSFAAVVSPPGGFWQDWPSSNITNITQIAKTENLTNSMFLNPLHTLPKKIQFFKPHLDLSSPNLYNPGKAMNIALASYDFVRFLYSDALCFTSSLVTIVLIIITPALGHFRSTLIYFLTLIVVASSMYLYYCVLALIANEQFAGWVFKVFGTQFFFFSFFIICSLITFYLYKRVLNLLCIILEMIILKCCLSRWGQWRIKSL